MKEKNLNKETKVNEVVQTREVKDQKKKGKPNVFVRFWNWLKKTCKNTFSEIKKVSWPTFAKVVKNTGIVLAVVCVFLVIITAFDFGLEKLLELVTGIGA